MKSVTIAVALLALAFGCSSGSSTSGASDAGKAEGDARKAEGDAATDAPLGDAATETVAAPTITMIMPMGGGLHVNWTNAEPACDTIELERKTETVPYKMVGSPLPGEADNKHDGTATEPVTYTYRVRCKKGGAYSAYSNEKSATP